MSDPMRATAERLAREVHDKHAQYGGMLPLEHCDKDVSERSIALALAGLTHRDRTAEREAARKALDALARSTVTETGGFCVGDGAIREWASRYLAAEFDAGERVTLSDGSVVEVDPEGIEWVRRGIPNSLNRVCKPEHWPLLVTELTGADFDAVKRLAEQRGAER